MLFSRGKEAFEGAVVEVHVRLFDPIPEGFRDDREPWFWELISTWFLFKLLAGWLMP